MASTYVNNLRLEEMATGEKSGTWGTISNTNLELIAQAWGSGTESFATDADTTVTIQDGTSDDARAFYLNVTSGVSLTATRTMTLAPNTVNKVWIIKNSTSGSQSINISQGSGANATIVNGQTAVIYTDGGGSGANVYAIDLVSGTASGDLTFADDVKAIFGSASDGLQIYNAAGGDKFISEAGSGNLKIQADNLYLQNSAGTENHIAAISNGAVTLYYDGDDKLATTATGVNVTGQLTATTSGSGETQLTIKSTSADASEGPRLDLQRDSSSPAANDATGTIRFIAEDSIGTNIVYSEIQSQIIDPTTGSTGGEMQLLVRRNGSLTEALSLHEDQVIFNESGNDVDFRIETNLNANGFFINGGSSTVGINRSPSYELDIAASDNANSELRVYAGSDSGAKAILRLQTQATAGTRESSIYFGDAADSAIGRIIYDHSNDHLEFFTNGAEDMRLESDGDLHVDGDVVAYSTTISDERLKENISGIEGALDKVNQLNGYTFTYKVDGKVSAGVIAQEVEKVLPEAVSEKELPLKVDDEEKYKVVNYDALHGLLIEAIKELKAEIEELKNGSTK